MCDYKAIPNGNNSFFLEYDDKRYCFSYCQCVAGIVDGKYEEYDGYKYYSRTSCKHKKAFRNYYGV